ncbi:MAG: UbiX family flavin prenyltransferase [Anaerovibrio sp.]|uniref:UbiX family flavin prenyltransferase n=1 Tax=Anaerovibrio sp. TaxID=1872532 RepID=UPI0025CDBCB4|nr:UbiX family flavin prenyltransferase [Anaerovibrio sp.]MCR5176468.1 UbiX family flavin prenyltransferase [Anaerovibrio sp.]
MKIIVGITGASGSIYGLRLVEFLKSSGHQVHMVITDSGNKVIEYECPDIYRKILDGTDMLYDVHDIGAAIASGSFRADAMVVVPASMKTVACIANGVTDNLLTRAADVMLKERRTLIMVPREAPMHAGHLENLLKVSRLGAVVIPASPGFYHKPVTVMDLVDMLVGKICDSLSIGNDLFERWKGLPGD